MDIKTYGASYVWKFTVLRSIIRVGFIQNKRNLIYKQTMNFKQYAQITNNMQQKKTRTNKHNVNLETPTIKLTTFCLILKLQTQLKEIRDKRL